MSVTSKMRSGLVIFCSVLGVAFSVLPEAVHGQQTVINTGNARSGHGVKVVDVTDDHKYTFNEENLELILLRDDVKNLPVVVVSVVGPYRGGKSFLLNFFLRYLTSEPAARADGSWLGDDSAPLQGFSWSGGNKLNTKGIVMWSEPFITSLPSGEKVAVLLMDTQGTFSSSSTVRDCSTIFAISTLISSVQLYNIAHNIQEDDLQSLQLFTEYAKLVKEQDSKAFQVLEFLVRDWDFPWEYSYGAAGGEKLLAEWLRVNPKPNGQQQDLRKHIRSSFDKVSCYFMPHPGFAVLNPKYKGEIKGLVLEFKEHLNLLASSIFSPAQLVPKLMNNEKMKARDLFTYFKSYMGIFNSEKFPPPAIILKATAEAGLLTAYEDALHLYVDNMTLECGEKSRLSVPSEDVKILHDWYKNQALTSFTNKKKLGSIIDANQTKEKLSKEIDTRCEEFASINKRKQLEAMEPAKEAYDAEIAKVTKGRPFCVHPEDVEKIHSRALSVSMDIFDAARKRYSKKPDAERQGFKQTLEKKYVTLKQDNDRKNKLYIDEGRIEYWEYMEKKCSQEPPLSATKLQEEHVLGLAKVKETFRAKRNQKDSYTEDVFISQLDETISERFNAMFAAINVYNNYINSSWNHPDQCLHPENLKNEHNAAVCNAIKSIRPQITCCCDYNSTDEAETALLNVLKSRYTELDKANADANNNAILHAVKFYVEKREESVKPFKGWLAAVLSHLDVAVRKRMSFLTEAKTEAINAFYSMRRNKGYEGTDPYRRKLETLLSDELNKFWRSLEASS